MEEARFLRIAADARAGNPTAMTALLVESFDPLRSILAQQMNTLPSEAQLEPEDVIQEVYAAAWSGMAMAGITPGMAALRM